MSGNRFRKQISATAAIRSFSSQSPLLPKPQLIENLEAELARAIGLALDGGLSHGEIAKVFRARAARLDGGRE